MPPSADRKSAASAPPGPVAVTILAPVLVMAAAALVWANSLSAPFVLDDHASLPGNASIRALWPPAWLHPPAAAGETVGGRPVLNLTFALNHALGGNDVRGYRGLNVIIHALAALALFGLVRRTLAGERDQPFAARPTGGTSGWALAVALAWLLHPLQTESVTYVVQRAESLCGLFYLLTLYTFVRGARPGAGRWLVFSVASCLLGMGTKEVMATAPLLVLLVDRAFVAGSFAAAWRLRRRYYLALASTWLLLLVLVWSSARRGGSVGYGADAGAWSYLLTQCRALVLYLRLAFWPAGQVFDYGATLVRSPAAVWWQATIVLSLLGATGWALARRPGIGTAAAAFFLLLAPSSSIVPVATQTIAEHRMYLPLAAVIVLAGAALHAALAGIPARARGIGAAGVILALGLATLARNQVYRSELALWQDTAAKRPDNPRAHHNLGLALLAAGRTDDAVAEFRRAVALQPNHAFARFQLGTVHLTQGQWPEAVGELQLALAADPHYTAAHVNLGQALAQLGRVAEAEAHYRAALAEEPGAQDARTNLAALLGARGRPAEAEALLREVVRAAPETAEAHYHLGLALGQLGRPAEAALREALRLRPSFASARLALGNLLAARGDVAGATAAFREAMQGDPRSAEARFAWGNLLARQQKFGEALSAYEAALALDAAHVQARNNLANCQLVLGRFREAIANYEAVLRVRPADEAVHRNLALAREALGGR